MCWCRYFAYRKLLLVIGAILFSKNEIAHLSRQNIQSDCFGCTNKNIIPFVVWRAWESLSVRWNHVWQISPRRTLW